jgi:phosphoribosylanthranilate isomerase
VREYADLKSNTYWLLDMSGGKGMLLDINHTRELLDLLDEESHPGQGVIVAGGLDPYNLGLLEPLRRERYKFSVDAESGLRDSVDRLDTERCIAFAMAGWELVK